MEVRKLVACPEDQLKLSMSPSSALPRAEASASRGYSSNPGKMHSGLTWDMMAKEILALGNNCLLN